MAFPFLSHLGGELLLTGRILGEVLADGLLKLGGLLGAVDRMVGKRSWQITSTSGARAY